MADIATPTHSPAAYGATAPGGPGPPHIEASQSHPDTPHSIGLLCASDQPVAETSHPTTHNTHKRLTSIPSVGLEPTIPASERPQTPRLTGRPLR